MSLPISLLPFISLATTILATPLKVQHQARANWSPPFTSCFSCFLSSWTQGQECSTDANLQKTISRVLNPPASATPTYTPTQWCSEFLRQTSWSTASTTSSGVSTYTSWTETHILVTTTDLDHPTSTVLCPIPSPSMECGWDTNTIAPIDQGEDWSIEHGYNPTDCQQVCLEHSGCKAYRIDGSDAKGWDCEIFNVGIGANATNLRNPTVGGSQWWDRDCQVHRPTACRGSGGRTATPALASTTDLPLSSATTPIPTSINAVPSHPLITSAPAPTAAPAPAPVHLAKRDAPIPPYLSDLSYFWSSIYLTPACSCLISSVEAYTSSTTTRTITKWTASTTVSSTYEDVFTVTVTPRSTTVYVSVD